MNNPGMHHPGQDMLPTRSSLLQRLRDWEDQESWRDFFDTYWKLIYAVAVKAGLSDADARDVVQETMVAAARGLQAGRFQIGGGSFKSWLLQITRRRISDHLRKPQLEPIPGRPLAEETSRTPLTDRIPDPAAGQIKEIWEEEWNKNLADAALEQARRKVGAKQYQIFDLYVLKEWPVQEITRTLHVNVAQVYLAKHRITRLAKQELRKLERGMKADILTKPSQPPGVILKGK